MRGGLSLCIFNKLPKSFWCTSMVEIHCSGAFILLVFFITESITLFNLQIIHMRNGDLSMSRSFNGEGNGTPSQYSCLENPMDGGAWWAAVHGVSEGQTRLSDFTFTFHFHALEKEMATRSSVLAWRIPGTGEPGGLPSMRSHRVGHDWSNLAVAIAVGHLNLVPLGMGATCL